MSSEGMPGSSMMDKTWKDTVKSAEHGCKRIIACKRQEGGAVSEECLKTLTGKTGIRMEKAMSITTAYIRQCRHVIYN